MTTDRTAGLLFVATGAAHVAAANAARASFAEHAPDLPACLFTDLPAKAEGFEIVETVDAAHGRSKVDCMPRTPFARTLYLDTDTLALADVSPVFELLDRFDMAAAHVPLWQRPAQNRAWKGGVPYVFPQVNSGVMLYRAEGAARAALDRWAAAYHAARADKGIGVDQVTLREVLWQADDLRLYILPPQWNKRVLEPSELIFSDLPRPVILHMPVFHPRKRFGWQGRLAARIGRWRWRQPRGLAPDRR